jgi:hypothetical protein
MSGVVLGPLRGPALAHYTVATRDSDMADASRARQRRILRMSALGRMTVNERLILFWQQ